MFRFLASAFSSLVTNESVLGDTCHAHLGDVSSRLRTLCHGLAAFDWVARASLVQSDLSAFTGIKRERYHDSLPRLTQSA